MKNLNVPADQLSDEEVLQELELGRHGQGAHHISTYLVEQQFTADEVRGYHRLMKWIALNQPKTWSDIVRAGAAAMTARGENDLKGLFLALAKDAPGMPILRLVPR